MSVRWVAGLGLLLLLAGASETFAQTRPRVFAGIEPVAWVVRQVAGDVVDVETLLPADAAPESFQPGARHLVRMADSEHLFVVGLPFERKLVQRLGGGGALPPVTDLSGGESGEIDPHVWLDPLFLRSMAETVTEKLVGLRPGEEKGLRERGARFDQRLRASHEELRTRLAEHEGEVLLTVHPAYGAFARRYGLRQVAVEQHGQAPTARHLASLVEELREKNPGFILTQPQHSDRGARMLARELDLRLVEVDPLAADVLPVLRRLADLVSADTQESP